MKNWKNNRPDGWQKCTIDNLTNYEGLTHAQCYEAGADAMHKADVAFLKRHHPALSYRSDRVGFITIDIQKEDWESFIKEA